MELTVPVDSSEHRPSMPPATTMARLAAALSVSLLMSGVAAAQSTVGEDRRLGAAQLFEEASREAQRGNDAEAAELFLRAHNVLPALPAIAQAVFYFEKADLLVRAANTAVELQSFIERVGAGSLDETEVMAATALFEDVLGRADVQLVRVDVECERCEATELAGSYFPASFYVEPGQEHPIALHLPGGERELHPTRGDAGQRLVIRPRAQGSDAEALEGEAGGAHRAAFYVLAAATVALGGATLWSGVDTLAGVEEFETEGARDLYDAGQAKERRTNGLIGATAGLAVATLVLAFFTDWQGESDDGGTDVALSVGADHVGAALTGTW